MQRIKGDELEKEGLIEVKIFVAEKRLSAAFVPWFAIANAQIGKVFALTEAISIFYEGKGRAKGCNACKFENASIS